MGISLIGIWFKMSIFIIAVLVIPTSVSFFINRFLFCFIISVTVLLWTGSILIFCFNSPIELIFLLLQCLQISEVTFLNWINFPTMLPFLELLVFLVLFNINMGHLYCLFTLTVEFMVSSPWFWIIESYPLPYPNITLQLEAWLLF